MRPWECRVDQKVGLLCRHFWFSAILTKNYEDKRQNIDILLFSRPESVESDAIIAQIWKNLKKITFCGQFWLFWKTRSAISAEFISEFKKKIIVNVGRQLYTLPENLKKIGAKFWPWEWWFQKMQNCRYDVIKLKILKSMAIQILQISIKICVQSFIKIGTLVLYQEKYNWKNRQIKVGLHVFFPKIRLKLFLFNWT